MACLSGEAVLKPSDCPLLLAVRSAGEGRFVVKLRKAVTSHENNNSILRSATLASLEQTMGRSRQRSTRNSQTPAAKLIESQRKRNDVNTDVTERLDRRAASVRAGGRSKSTSSAFRKSLSLRKSSRSVRAQAELSTDDTPPGVLRIFGPEISPGTQYKSVLASSNSCARELIAEALDRYAIHRHYTPYFVLCDVIGRVAEASGATEWHEECARIVGDDERPLTLQSLWKPSEGSRVASSCATNATRSTRSASTNAPTPTAPTTSTTPATRRLPAARRSYVRKCDASFAKTR